MSVIQEFNIFIEMQFNCISAYLISKFFNKKNKNITFSKEKSSFQNYSERMIPAFSPFWDKYLPFSDRLGCLKTIKINHQVIMIINQPASKRYSYI